MKVYEILESIDNLDYDKAFELFSDTYNKSTGASWDKGKFLSRARNWTFYGDENGFVAVRPQRSGLVKLVGAAGSHRSILKGMTELGNESRPIWGMVSSEMVGMLKKLGYIQPPAWIIKAMMKLIPATVFGDVPFTVNSDGSLTFSYSDVGDATKYFLGNSEYFKFMIAAFKKKPTLAMRPLIVAIERLIR